jgi:hydrogenase/urease accessory protein HupE
VVELGPDQEDGGYFLVRYACEAESMVLTIRLGPLFDAMRSGHRMTAFVHVPGEERPRDSLLHGSSAVVEVPLSEEAVVAAPAPRSGPAIAWECIVLGVEHILFGIDHIVFLFGLVLLGGRLRDLAATITAFTLSHSVTLALTVLGVVAPQPTLIEPLIALSVAYVGIENFIVKDLKKRWRIAAGFGLIHGFGFAGAVGDKLPTDRLPLALGTFNLGVEAGQLMLLAVLVPILALLHKQGWFQKRGVQVLSGLVVAAGLFWFVERVFL